MLPTSGPSPARTRTDRCPGIVHPWPADDGGLARIRIPGGRISLSALRALLTLAEEYGAGRVHVTERANLQVRALPAIDGRLAEPIVSAIEAAGLLRSRAHDRVRNVLASPQTGLAGGRADLRPVVATLDDLLCADPVLAGLPGRFLFTLDDGRGDLAERHRDLGLVALDEQRAQLVVGADFGAVVPLQEAAAAITQLAHQFLDARGTGPNAPWHVTELEAPLVPPVAAAPGAEVSVGPLAFGPVAGGEHVAVPDGIDTTMLAAWAERLHSPAQADPAVVITPWHGVLIPEEIR